jgi:hypothetical protein
MPTLNYLNSTTLRLLRVDSTGLDFDVICHVVSLSAGVSVQNIATTIASSTTSITPTISTVTVANSVVTIACHLQEHSSANTANDDYGVSAMELTNLTSTAFTATRADSDAASCTANVQVLSFTPATAGSWFLLAYKNELYNSQNINGMR